MICQCCNDVVSTMTAMGKIPLNGTVLLLGVEEYSVVQLSPSYPSYFDAASNETETSYNPQAQDICCPQMLVHVISPISCVATPAWNNLVADTAEVSCECLPASEAAAAAFGWTGGCVGQQFERKVIVGPCCVYPDAASVPDSYKQSYSVANSYPLIKCWQQYSSTSSYTYQGQSSEGYTYCGVTETNYCDTFHGIQYDCDYYNADSGCLVIADHGNWTQLAENAATQCQGYNCESTPYVWTDNYHGWCHVIQRCKDCSSYSTYTSSYSMLAEQNSECYSCGDTCRWQCGDSQTSCYDWLNNCESYGGCPSECPESCGFEESSSSAI